MTNDDVAALLLDYINRQDAFTLMVANWSTGTALGGPNGDGLYPLPVGPASTRLVACPERMRLDAARFSVRTLTGPGSFLMVAADAGKVMRIGNGSVTNNINVNLPNLPEGTQFMFLQVGSGRLVFQSSGGSTVVHRQNFNRTAGLYAMATAVCDSVSSGISRWVLGGDLAAA